jgi:hypothetical protein
MSVHVEITGVDKLIKRLMAMTPNVEKAVSKELVDVCLDLRGKSQQLAPVDLGALQASAYHEVNGLNGEVGYTEEYALRQHEEMGYRHTYPGQAKYLETPYKANKSRYEKALIDAAKKGL